MHFVSELKFKEKNEKPSNIKASLIPIVYSTLCAVIKDLVKKNKKTEDQI